MRGNLAKLVRHTYNVDCRDARVAETPGYQSCTCIEARLHWGERDRPVSQRAVAPATIDVIPGPEIMNTHYHLSVGGWFHAYASGNA